MNHAGQGTAVKRSLGHAFLFSLTGIVTRADRLGKGMALPLHQGAHIDNQVCFYIDNRRCFRGPSFALLFAFMAYAKRMPRPPHTEPEGRVIFPTTRAA